MALKVARRAGISPFIVMDVMRAANRRDEAAAHAGERAVHLEVGQPGTQAPTPVRDAAKAALDADKLGYTDAMGLPALRARIARHYADAYGIALDPSRICVTTGSSGGFLLAFLAAAWRSPIQDIPPTATS
jgi:aspartate/methionine/tyrosine aminotransferase